MPNEREMKSTPHPSIIIHKLQSMQYLISALFVLTALVALKGHPPTNNDEAMLKAGCFSSENPEVTSLPEHWKRMNFTGLKRTRYSLEELNGKTVVKAVSEQSSSGLVRELEVDLKEYPIMRWSWKTSNIIQNSDLTKKDGDDYPARIYLMFDYDIRNLSWGERQRIRILRAVYGRIPTRAMNYIWENKAPLGTVAPNPYTDLVTMVVVENGDGNTGKWLHYERNVYQDYIDIFGEEPPLVGAIAIMSDSDDTGESATTWFGDITFHKPETD